MTWLDWVTILLITVGLFDLLARKLWNKVWDLEKRLSRLEAMTRGE